jgi:hypothetical protein
LGKSIMCLAVVLAAELFELPPQRRKPSLKHTDDLITDLRREPDRRRRGEERPSRSEQSTGTATTKHNPRQESLRKRNSVWHPRPI